MRTIERMNNTRYTFGTSETAARRLQKLSEVFNPHSQGFIRKYAQQPVASAVDLGCGPGYTTHMLYMASDTREIYGMDNSEEFLERAMDRFGHCVFVNHDLTETPFPVKPDLMYGRFVLSHLPSPVEQVNTWVKELSQDGALLIEEVEDVRTDVPVFKKYLSVNRGLVASQGAKLFVGKDLSRGQYSGEVVANEAAEMRISNSDAAAMFYPNTASVWKKEEYVLDTTSPSERKEIADALQEMARSRDGKSDITWKMRRIVLRNREKDPYLWLFI